MVSMVNHLVNSVLLKDRGLITYELNEYLNVYLIDTHALIA